MAKLCSLDDETYSCIRKFLPIKSSEKAFNNIINYVVQEIIFKV